MLSDVWLINGIDMGFFAFHQVLDVYGQPPVPPQASGILHANAVA